MNVREKKEKRMIKTCLKYLLDVHYDFKGFPCIKLLSRQVTYFTDEEKTELD